MLDNIIEFILTHYLFVEILLNVYNEIIENCRNICVTSH